jgi:phage-related protein
MELDLSAVAVYEIEKNKIATTGAWLILLEIQYEDVTIRIVNNTEDIEWPAGSGQIWHRFPFRLGEVSEDKGGEIPQFTLRVSNVHRTVGRYLEQYRGGTDATATIRVVHSKHLDNPKPVTEEYFQAKKANVDAYWVTFTLGPDHNIVRRYPSRRYMKNFCPYGFGDIECGYSGTGGPCNYTLKSCRELGNSHRFGGEPGIPGVSTYV